MIPHPSLNANLNESLKFESLLPTLNKQLQNIIIVTILVKVATNLNQVWLPANTTLDNDYQKLQVMHSIIK